MITPARGRFSKVFALRWSRPVAVIVCAALGFLCPAVYGLVNGVREPLAHDEYSYLLAAYTFAEGRLTNPPPALPEFFEAPHVLVVPTYTSKYPPGQSLFLALGIVVGGSPIWGVWLGCGLFAGCLCWMLQAWSTRQWAIATTLLAIATLGTSTYWAQAYWGGMVAASGGALVFGGMRRTLHTVRISTSVLIAAGTLILANTRPYEGLITCLPAVVVLAVWLVRCDRVPSRIKLLSFALPVAIVLAAGAAGMAVYNRAVTGAFSASPYQVHQAQYWRQGPFVFSQPQNASRTPGDRVSGFYRYYESPARSAGSVLRVSLQNLALAALGSIGVPFGIFFVPPNQQYQGVLLWVALLLCARNWRSRSSAAILSVLAVLAELIGRKVIPAFFLASLAGVAIPWAWAFTSVARRNAWAPFIAAAWALGLTAHAAVRWWWPHYSAPVVALLLAAVATTGQRLTRQSKRTGGNTLGRALTAMAVVHLLVLGAVSVLSRPTAGVVARRTAIIRQLEVLNGSHLVFVKYAANYTVHDEWVYNPPDLAASRILFAHDLGEERNRALLKEFPERSIWRVNVSSDAIRLERYGGTP